jgi:elongation factor 1-beta
MGFGDLTSDSGLQALNDYLANRSYIEGYIPSQADVAVFKAVGNCPTTKYINASRWYRHINSYTDDEKLAFPGIQKPVGEYGNGNVAAAPPKGAADDDDFDLFASDDEEESAENEAIKQQRLAEYQAKKSKSV